mgnify:CR=1 FL=1
MKNFETIKNTGENEAHYIKIEAAAEINVNEHYLFNNS